MMCASEEEFSFVACNSCGLIYLNPRVPAGELGKYYTDSYLPYRGEKAWGKYSELVKTGQKRVDQRRVNVVKEAYSGINADTHVLDVGCGKPTFLKALQSVTGCRVTGIDFTSKGWENTNEFEKIELIEGELGQVSLQKEPDVVTLWHYLEHDYYPARTLQHLRTLVKPEARLIIEVPNYQSITRKWQGKTWAGYHTPRHTAIYTPTTLTMLLNNNGWKVRQMYSYGTLDAYPLWWMGKQEKKRIDWTESMERRFIPFVWGNIVYSPLFALQKYLSLGIQLAIAEPA